jgi:hypothetical protein
MMMWYSFKVLVDQCWNDAVEADSISFTLQALMHLDVWWTDKLACLTCRPVIAAVEKGINLAHKQRKMGIQSSALHEGTGQLPSASMAPHCSLY